MKKILFLNPNNICGSPAMERVNAFSSFYKKKGFVVDYIDYPKNIVQLIRLIFYIYRFNVNCLFVSQPPFKYFLIFFLPFVKKIIDYRDGWSIAINNGYGGMVKENSKKALVAKIIEFIAMKQSDLIITCTPGLYEYLHKLSGKDILMITNGISIKNFDLISNISTNLNVKKEKITKFYCAGKFSEAGVDRVVDVLNIIDKRYQGDIEIHLIGCDFKSNSWLEKYVKERFKIFFYPKMGKEELYLSLNNADYFLSLVRDPNYEFGTKVFEYIAFRKPILNYLNRENSFNKYFDGAFDVNLSNDSIFNKNIIRETLIDEHANKLISIFK